jgi:hypothetical protein
MDLIISAVEINDHHGVGIFLNRLFPDSTDFFAIRASSIYGGENQFGSIARELGKEAGDNKQRAILLQNVLQTHNISRILAVPYYKEDFENAYLAKHLTRAPLCVYLMDDQNIFDPQVPNKTVYRLLRAADLRLAISQEMALAYQEKFGMPFHILPPVMTMLPAEASPGDAIVWAKQAALLGNIWRPETFRLFRQLIRDSDLRVDWFGNGPRASWLNTNAADLKKDHIFCPGFLPDTELLQRLREYPFMIVPSGSLGPEDPNVAFSRLSLPSRLIFGLVGARIPILVLGGEETAAGRFVRSLQIGTVAGYSQRDFGEAICHMMDPINQRGFRENGQRVASRFVLEEGGEWIWRSLKRRKPATSQFSEVFPLPVQRINPLQAVRKYLSGKKFLSENKRSTRLH